MRLRLRKVVEDVELVDVSSHRVTEDDLELSAEVVVR